MRRKVLRDFAAPVACVESKARIAEAGRDHIKGFSLSEPDHHDHMMMMMIAFNYIYIYCYSPYQKLRTQCLE